MKIRYFAVPVSLFILTGCDLMEIYPMQNLQTGEHIACTTWREAWGLTRVEQRQLDACIQACQKQGFFEAKRGPSDIDLPKASMGSGEMPPTCASKRS